jgi:3-dehydrosphinganine reductase
LIFFSSQSIFDYFRHVLITGGGTGLGQGLACHFAALGANVTVMSRSMNHLEETSNLCEGYIHGTATGDIVSGLLVEKPLPGKNFAEVLRLTCDVTKEDELKEKVAEAVARFGAFDLVVTSAGFSKPQYCMNASISEYEDQLALNYLGTVKTVRATLPFMLEKGSGSYIIVSSALALMGYDFQLNCPTFFCSFFCFFLPNCISLHFAFFPFLPFLLFHLSLQIHRLQCVLWIKVRCAWLRRSDEDGASPA